MAHESIADNLEALVDKADLSTVLETLVDICNGKAEHLRTNWQDENEAKAWDKDAATIDKVLGKIIN